MQPTQLTQKNGTWEHFHFEVSCTVHFRIVKKPNVLFITSSNKSCTNPPIRAIKIVTGLNSIFKNWFRDPGPFWQAIKLALSFVLDKQQVFGRLVKLFTRQLVSFVPIYYHGEANLVFHFNFISTNISVLLNLKLTQNLSVLLDLSIWTFQ